MKLKDKHILIIVSGGVASYKTPELIRRLRDDGAMVRCVMTASARNFIQPTLLSAISGSPVATDLFDANSGMDVGHIRLARESDLIIVAPATANILARMANGLADDLATSILLARDTPVLVAPAMNPKMWSNPATLRNIKTLQEDGIHFIGPESGEMAESGEAGLGRLADPQKILQAATQLLLSSKDLLANRSFLVTSGPTEEPLDPVRYISNRSSGKQGHAIARALQRLGARVCLVTGPVSLADPPGIETIHVQTAAQMLSAVEAALPVDGAIFAAAVADWRPAVVSEQKIKKPPNKSEDLSISFVRNPDILATIGHHARRPSLVIGFAAETTDLIANAEKKLHSKGADWILANDVSTGTGVFGGDNNQVHLLSRDAVETWAPGTKQDVANELVRRIVQFFTAPSGSE